MMEEENFLIELLKINSESGKEKEIGKFIAKKLGKNFSIIKQPIDEKIGNFNIFASVGKPKIILATHLDTVPGYLEIKNDSEYIYGRGACDSKVNISSMILSAEKAIEQGINNFGLLFTVQEETDFAGAKKALELIPNSTNLIVYGEPTDLKIISGQKGLITLKLSCKGKSAHGSTPEKGVNAIELLIENLKKLKQIKFERNENLGENSINIGLIKGGTSMNTVPDYAEATIEIRNTIEPEIILKRIKQELKNTEIEIINFYEPTFNKEAEKIARKMNIETKIVSYFTEMYFFNKKAKTIVLGAGKEEDAHSQNEKIKIKDLKRLIEIYLGILKGNQ